MAWHKVSSPPLGAACLSLCRCCPLFLLLFPPPRSLALPPTNERASRPRTPMASRLGCMAAVETALISFTASVRL